MLSRRRRLEGVGMRRYKIASRSVKDRALIEAVARTGKPMLVSLGMWDGADFPKITSPGGVEYLYCVSKYPTEMSDLHFGKVDFTRSVSQSLIVILLKPKRSSIRNVLYSVKGNSSTPLIMPNAASSAS